ncbi:MAG TPA: VWA domain-containing protein [Thermoanaerobaculia bacterium]|nr:VWA domain-containing protein [Thermoanaerobaculia bacterium]
MKRIWRTFGALALVSTALGAVQPRPAPLPEIGASIDVRVVNVEAVVTDRRGERIEGLRAADFRLLVDGREVPIDYFTEVRGGQAVAGPGAEPAPGAEASAAAPASPVPAGPVGMSYLVFIDESFAVAAQRDYLLKRLEGDLQRIGPEDRMAVVAFDGRNLDLLSDWTGDRKVLRRTLQEARSRPSKGIKRLVDRRQDEADQDLGLEGWYAVPYLYDEVRSAAEAASAAMRGISAPPPGRKALLLLTSGWAPLSPYYPDASLYGLPSVADLATASDLFEPVTGTANLLGYTIYPVMTPAPVAETSWADASQAGPTPLADLGFISSSWDLGVNETVNYVAHETGGVPIFNSWRQSALAKVEKDTRSYYWLGFTPEWHADGRNHEIRVEVRRPDLEVRSRSGFSDLSRVEQASLRTDNLLLFGNGQNVRPIQVETGAPRRTGLLSIELPVTLVLPADLLTPLPVAGGYELRARLAMTSLDRWGGKTEHRNLELRLKLPTAPNPGDFARYRTQFKLRKLDQRLVFAVQDEVGEGEGRAEVDFKP